MKVDVNRIIGHPDTEVKADDTEVVKDGGEITAFSSTIKDGVDVEKHPRQEAQDVLCREWKAMAVVADRFFLGVFLVLIVAFSVAVMVLLIAG